MLKALVLLRYTCSAYVLHRVRVIKGQGLSDGVLVDEGWGQGRWDKGLPTLDPNFIYQDRLPTRDERPPAIKIERELQDAIKVVVTTFMLT